MSFPSRLAQPTQLPRHRAALPGVLGQPRDSAGEAHPLRVNYCCGRVHPFTRTVLVEGISLWISAGRADTFAGGVADSPFPRSVRDAVLAEGLAAEQLSYLRSLLEASTDPRTLLEHESAELNLTPHLKALLAGLLPAAATTSYGSVALGVGTRPLYPCPKCHTQVTLCQVSSVASQRRAAPPQATIRSFEPVSASGAYRPNMLLRSLKIPSKRSSA